MLEPKIYIANLAKYTEGKLVGDWFTFPVDIDEVKEKILTPYGDEEFAIHDYDNTYFPVGENDDIDYLNEMIEDVESLDSCYQNNFFDLVKESGYSPDRLIELINNGYIIHHGNVTALDVAMEHADEQIACHLDNDSQKSFFTDYFDYNKYLEMLEYDMIFVKVSGALFTIEEC